MVSLIATRLFQLALILGLAFAGLASANDALLGAASADDFRPGVELAQQGIDLSNESER